MQGKGCAIGIEDTQKMDTISTKVKSTGHHGKEWEDLSFLQPLVKHSKATQFTLAPISQLPGTRMKGATKRWGWKGGSVRSPVEELVGVLRKKMQSRVKVWINWPVMGTSTLVVLQKRIYIPLYLGSGTKLQYVEWSNRRTHSSLCPEICPKKKYITFLSHVGLAGLSFLESQFG